jgi:O-antigen ligase
LTSTATSTTTRATTGISTRATTDSSRRRARPRLATAGAIGLLAIVGWTTFAFAGVYPSTLAAPAILCVVLAAGYRVWSRAGWPVPALQAWLGVYLAAIALQMLPLPAPILDLVSPHVRPTMAQLSLALPARLPLTIDEPATGGRLLVNAALTAIFLASLRIFATGGVRLFARGLSMMGLILSLIALAQDATGHGLMYWRWRQLEEGGSPFGPFVNRNHFATWAVLAIPFALGYLAAHSGAHRTRSTGPLPLRRRLVTFVDGRAILLAASACLMTVALIATLSRSGMLGLSAAAIAAVAFRLYHPGEGAGRTLWWVAAAATGAALLLGASMPLATIVERLARTHVSAADRMMIWRDTLPMIRDFWLTGAGAGTYETGMLVYQRASPGVRFNQAHNHYLQLAAEGGLLLCVPLGAALALYVRQAWRRVAAEASGMFWIRAGAFCGLAGAAAQSIWETGLVTPANAALASVLAAIVIHEPRRH